MLTPAKRVTFAVLATGCVAVVGYYFGVPAAVARDVTAESAISWLGLVITVFSLVVALFLAILAIEAYSHVSSLRALEEKYRVASERFSVTEAQYLAISEAISSYSRDVLEITTRYMMKLDAADDAKDDFSARYTILRSKLEISLLPPDKRTSLDHIESHILVIVEEGSPADLRFALDALQRVEDRHAAYPYIGEVLRRMRSGSSSHT